jgi:hypothetical protein
MKRLKVRISAYACEPSKGSETGVGWNWARQIARFHEAWVITRANYRELTVESHSIMGAPNLRLFPRSRIAAGGGAVTDPSNGILSVSRP